jgi:hypothetical protein
MAARLENDRPPDLIRMPVEPVALLEETLPGRTRHSFDDEAQRLPTDVRVDRLVVVDHSGLDDGGIIVGEPGGGLIAHYRRMGGSTW